MLRSRVVSGMILVGIATGNYVHATEGEKRRVVVEALKSSLPKFDDPSPAEAKADGPSKSGASSRSGSGASAGNQAKTNAVAESSAVPDAAAMASTDRDSAGRNDGTPRSEVLQLNTLTITSTPIFDYKATVPRIAVPKVSKAVEIDPFTSAEAREKLLIEKHLGLLDRFVLGKLHLPFVGQSLAARAQEAEAIHHSSVQLNELAEVLDVVAVSDSDKEELMKLKEEYRKIYMARPK